MGSNQMKTVPALKDYYFKQVVPILKKQFGYKNIHVVPKVEKVVLNSRINADADKAHVEQLVKEMSLIAGQKPLITKAKKSISNFKLRQGIPTGVKVTLRGNRMYDFLYRLINIALPVIRDFRGVSKKMDRRGNLNVGIMDHTIFPEIKVESSSRQNIGMDIAVVTTARSDKEGLSLLEGLGVVFRK
jgi:large subunit ribosomal protein L5